MKTVLLGIAALMLLPLQAEAPLEYRTRKAFEAGSESEQKQIDAIRECAVSKIQSCVYPLIEQLKKEGKENATLRRECANALGRLRAPEARDPLLQALADAELVVQASVAEALGLLGEAGETVHRIGMLRESVEIVRSMWTERETTYDGAYYRVHRANCDPKPLQSPHPPIPAPQGCCGPAKAPGASCGHRGSYLA